jgi:hypothetical protein
MRGLKNWMTGAALMIAMSTASVAQAEPNMFVFSANGPGAGKGAIGMGGRVYLIVPTFDLNYVRGFSDNFDFVLNLSTLGVITFSDVGVRFKLAGSRESGFALALKAAATPVFYFLSVGSGTSGGVAFGATPGIVASFGGQTTQFSLGFDFPMFFGAAAFATGDGNSSSASTGDFTPTLRPSATIEFPVGDTTGMYVQAQGIIPLEDGGVLAPIIAVGAEW